MTDGGMKSQALAAIDAELTGWETLVAEVGEERWGEPGVAGEWSFAKIAAHLADWRLYSIDRLEAAAKGESDPPPPWPAEMENEYEINAWFESRRGEAAPSDLVEGATVTYAWLRAAVEALPESVLTNPARFPWLEGAALGPALIDGSFFGHLHEEHEPDIRGWLAESRGVGVP